MSPSEQIDDYARGWAGLMKLVRNGHSWSGSERNRFFINGGEGKFHEMSHLGGLDQTEDGRGMALVDWDQDGRLDIWYRNRSAPRLRLMKNQHEGSSAINLKLEGTASNRDGIGAVVELLPAIQSKRLVRSVKAGDLFLSQSSKWLHFGLGKEANYTHAMVVWPGGERERFDGLKGQSGRFFLKQGTGKVEVVPARTSISIKTGAIAKTPRTNGNARIILPARVPFPLVTFRDQAAKLQPLPSDGKPRLLILWSGRCRHCGKTLEKISKSSAKIRMANLDVLALAVDAIGGPAADVTAAYDIIDQTKFPFTWGLTDARSASLMHHFQEALFDRTPAASVPLAILLDQGNRAVAIYRGEISITKVLQDWRALASVNAVQRFHFAPPMAGTWFTNPLPQREVDRLFPAASK